MSREHPFSLHRLVPVLVLVVLGTVAIGWLRGPDWFQRLYHPLAYRDTIASVSRARKVDPYLVAAVINVESGYNAYTTSKAGAVGLMQVLPSTAAEVARLRGLDLRVDAEGLRNPETNILIGTTYLASLLGRYDNNTVSALAAYNGGMQNTDRWRMGSRDSSAVRQSIDFPETKRYVSRVLRERRYYLLLYPEAFPERKR